MSHLKVSHFFSVFEQFLYDNDSAKLTSSFAVFCPLLEVWLNLAGKKVQLVQNRCFIDLSPIEAGYLRVIKIIFRHSQAHFEPFGVTVHETGELS